MPWDIRRDRGEESRDVAQLGVRVVEARDDQRDDLEPEPHAVQPLDRLEHRGEHAAELPVVRVVEALEIDLVEIDPRAQVVEHLGRRVAVRHVGADEAPRPALTEHVHRPLARDQGLVVGRRENARAMAYREVRDLRGGHLLGWHAHHRIAQRLRGQGVVTEGTVILASEHPEGEGARARVRMEERLLLDGVELEAGDVARRNHEAPVLVPAHLADAALVGRDQAAVAARVAAHAGLGEPLVQLALARQASEHIGQRRHGALIVPALAEPVTPSRASPHPPRTRRRGPGRP